MVKIYKMEGTYADSIRGQPYRFANLILRLLRGTIGAPRANCHKYVRKKYVHRLLFLYEDS